ncbi:MAG: outer membrane protein assembly factor BamE [Burkholderiales bacterium]
MLPKFSRFSLIPVLVLATALLSACAGPQWSFIYKAEVVQGNVITKEQAERLKLVMERDQVRDILGSPMIADIFHADRWDYMFTIRRPGAAAQQRHVVALFQADRLKSLEAPDLPSEREFVASIDAVKPPKSIPSLVLSPEQIKALPVPAAAPSQAQAPQGAQRNYPPLLETD